MSPIPLIQISFLHSTYYFLFFLFTPSYFLHYITLFLFFFLHFPQVILLIFLSLFFTIYTFGNTVYKFKKKNRHFTNEICYSPEWNSSTNLPQETVICVRWIQKIRKTESVLRHCRFSPACVKIEPKTGKGIDLKPQRNRDRVTATREKRIHPPTSLKTPWNPTKR